MEGGGGKGYILGLNVFFIVEGLGKGSTGVIFFTKSLWDRGKGALRFFSFFFLMLKGGGQFFFFPGYMKR